jgi:four helix bundle protein
MKQDFEFPFERLRVWQQAREWIGTIYAMTQTFPKAEQYNFTSQMNRAALSVATNVAEGSARISGKDQAHFSSIAYGSLMETACLSILACDRGYISSDSVSRQRKEIAAISNQINALRNSQLSK